MNTKTKPWKATDDPLTNRCTSNIFSTLASETTYAIRRQNQSAVAISNADCFSETSLAISFQLSLCSFQLSMSHVRWILEYKLKGKDARKLKTVRVHVFQTWKVVGCDYSVSSGIILMRYACTWCIDFPALYITQATLLDNRGFTRERKWAVTFSSAKPAFS